MRIALISTPFVAVPPRTYGGTELVVHELAEGLVARGHSVTIFATGDSATTAELQSLYPQAQWPPDILTDVNHISWAMRQVQELGGFDLVHAHSAVALAYTRMARVRLIYTLHHERDERLSNFYHHFPEVQFIAISHDQRRREIPLRFVEVIHHGLEPSTYQWTDRPSDYVCFVGRFTRVKGPHTAIDVARRAGVPIRMAGEVHPPDREWADRELQHRLALPGVRYVGCIGPALKVPLLRDARALLVPIDWNEPFGLILIEAMLSGCPVVAFRRGSAPELIEEGVTGFIADSPEQMTQLIQPGGAVDRIDRRRCRERAVQRFGRERMIVDHERLYARMLREPDTGLSTTRRVA